MHVLHVIPSVAKVHGGPSLAIVLMEEALCAGCVKVTTVTTDDDGPGRRLRASARPAVAHGANRIYLRKWCEFYKVAPGIVPWLFGHVRSFDVVHIHALFSFTSVAAALLASWRGIPYVIRPLGTLNHYGITRRRALLKRLSLMAIEAPL